MTSPVTFSLLGKDLRKASILMWLRRALAEMGVLFPLRKPCHTLIHAVSSTTRRAVLDESEPLWVYGLDSQTSFV